MNFRKAAFLLAALIFCARGAQAFKLEEAIEPEALRWVQEACPADFLSSRTQFSRRAAERLVRRLYTAGALNVTVMRLLDGFAGFRVFLPLDPERRRDLLFLVNGENAACSQERAEDTGQEDLILWFCPSSCHAPSSS